MRKPRRGWLVQKALWGVDRRFHGRILIRGHEVGGVGHIRFEGGKPVPNSPGRQLRMHRQISQPSLFYVPSVGCYVFQLDGRGFSRSIGFRVVAIGAG